MSSRILRAVSAALACSLAVVVVGGPTSAEETVSESEVPLRVGTYNIRAGVSTATFDTAVHQLVPKVDVAGLQEVNSRDKQAVLAELDGWDHFRPPRYYGEQNPVIWNEAAFRLVSAGSVRIAPETDVGDEVPGKSGRIRAQYVSVVRLVHRASNQNVSIVNLHLVPGAVRGGRPWPDRPRLFELYASELVNVITLTQQESQWGKTFVLGDYNAGWVPDERYRKRRLPFRRFGSIGMTSMWATERPARIGTHNDALIDQVYTDTRASTARVAAGMTLSDHRPAIAGYDLPLAAG